MPWASHGVISGGRGPDVTEKVLRNLRARAVDEKSVQRGEQAESGESDSAQRQAEKRC